MFDYSGVTSKTLLKLQDLAASSGEMVKLHVVNFLSMWGYSVNVG